MRRTVSAAVALLLFSLAAPAAAQTPPVSVDLKSATGENVGSATLTETTGGVEIKVQAKGLPAGLHGIHLHAVGQCDPTDFATAGGHFNPGGKKHGLKNPDGPHAGDLPNIEIGADGAGTLTTTKAGVTLGSGLTSLNDSDGTALVIHAAADDDMTDPAGNSGARIACGIAFRNPAPVAAQPAAAPAPAPAAAPAPVAAPPAQPSQLPRTGQPLPLAAVIGLPLGALLLAVGIGFRRRA